MKPAFQIGHTLLVLLSFAAIMGGVTAGRGQSALDGFDPNANGPVNVVILQPDGKILIGGDFTSLAPNGALPVTRNRVARQNPDGTLDTAFNPNSNATVAATPASATLEREGTQDMAHLCKVCHAARAPQSLPAPRASPPRRSVTIHEHDC